jgi:hypothetical protein
VILALMPVVLTAHPAPQVIDWIWEHVGGKKNYEKARYLEFTYAYEVDGDTKSARHHTWDRYSGDYVLKYEKDGHQYEAYFNVETKKGIGLKDGEIIEGAGGAEIVERSYSLFINDTYWLLMPVKLQDYGVRLRYVRHEGEDAPDPEGHLKKDHSSHDHEEEKKKKTKHGVDSNVILNMTYLEDVGMTPGDQYWIYVNHEGSVTRWDYKLQGGHEGSWNWVEEKDCGMGIVLSTRKNKRDGDGSIVFSDVKFSETMDPATFKYASAR